MTTLEQRITETVATHLEHHGDEYDLRFSASIRKLSEHVTAVLAPLIREAQERAWDELLGKLQGTIGAYTEEGVWALEQASRLNPNPYRSNDE